MADPKKLERLTKKLSGPPSWPDSWLDEPKGRDRAAEALGKLGDTGAVPHLIKTLADYYFVVRKAAAEALGKLGNASAVPHLIKALADVAPGVREAAAAALAKLQLNFFGDSWPQAGEFNPHPMELMNSGAGPAFVLSLSVFGQAVGQKISLYFKECPAGDRVPRTLSVCPQAPGSAVPLRWELTYDDIKGPEQRARGTLYLAVKGSGEQSNITIGTIGTIVQGSVGGDVVDIDVNKYKADSASREESSPYAACPYCGEELNLPKTPRFCPHCREKLAIG